MNQIKNVFTVMLGALLGSGLTLFVVAYFFGGEIKYLSPNFPYLIANDVTSLAHVDQLRVQRLLDKNVIFSADDLLGQIGAFYSTIVAFLIGLITVMSLFTFFFVKASAEEKAEAQAKTVAREAVDDKITPKIQQIDEHLNRYNEYELSVKIEGLLQYKILDSVHFWDKIDESIYSKSEESLEDYDIESLRQQLTEQSEKIINITSTIQQLNDTLDNLTSESDSENVVELDTELNNGNTN
ncbi:hypothetical protein NTE17_004135 [Vibrio fluvialis]|nr:hypothetical protein [Vibrio fluvialis]